MIIGGTLIALFFLFIFAFCCYFVQGLQLNIVRMIRELNI